MKRTRMGNKPFVNIKEEDVPDLKKKIEAHYAHYASLGPEAYRKEWLRLMTNSFEASKGVRDSTLVLGVENEEELRLIMELAINKYPEQKYVIHFPKDNKDWEGIVKEMDAQIRNPLTCNSSGTTKNIVGDIDLGKVPEAVEGS